MLTQIKLRHFRCFDSFACDFAPGLNIFCGRNAQGKTSLLEAASILLRLQSPRITQLGRAIQHGKKGFVVDGYFAQSHLQFYFSPERKKLALDSVEQKDARQYLEIARIVYFSNQDAEIVRGPAEHRRGFLDFVATQIDPSYRRHLRDFERALRLRNLLLKAPRPDWREIGAFDRPLINAGNYVTAVRSALVSALQPAASEAHAAVSGSERLELGYASGAGEDFARSLHDSRQKDLRLRQTQAGPHRDDLRITVDARDSSFASEGQERTVALALKLAQARLLGEKSGASPLLLIDDIFGELDLERRRALLGHLPPGSQKLITTTRLEWISPEQPASVIQLSAGKIVDRSITP